MDALLRELAPVVLGATVRRYRDFPAAEDAVQEALLAASRQWPIDGVPDNPRGWLIQVAARRFADQARADIARKRRELEAAPDDELAPTPEEDDTLTLLLMCCHPALTRPTAIALTLRAVGGLTTAAIARAFLVPETTMAQRISRAKQTIQQSGIPFAPPAPDELDARLDAVLHVLYLIFNEGYERAELARDAIRMTRTVHAAFARPEVAGLLALMLLTDARRDARSGPGGEIVPLDEQDRDRWDRAAIAEGVALITGAFPRGAVGPYQLQAAIAAVHDAAPRVEDTDWGEILALYGVLERMTGNPVVTLNRAVAAAMVHGPAAGLAMLAPLDDDPRLSGHHRLAAIRAHLHERAGDRDAAVRHYRIAAAGTTSTVERDYLIARAARLSPED